MNMSRDSLGMSFSQETSYTADVEISVGRP